MSFYVISSNQKIDTYKKWEDCNKNIQGFANPCYIIFENIEDAKVAKEKCHSHPGLNSKWLIVDYRTGKGSAGRPMQRVSAHF
jgi:viroplasmin and RNaseH domain-containing protein